MLYLYSYGSKNPNIQEIIRKEFINNNTYISKNITFNDPEAIYFNDPLSNVVMCIKKLAETFNDILLERVIICTYNKIDNSDVCEYSAKVFDHLLYKVRGVKNSNWMAVTLFGFSNENGTILLNNMIYNMSDVIVIPYNSYTKELLGTTDNPKYIYAMTFSK